MRVFLIKNILKIASLSVEVILYISLKKSETNSLLVSRGLMSPEVYTLEAVLDSYISGNEKPRSSESL